MSHEHYGEVCTVYSCGDNPPARRHPDPTPGIPWRPVNPPPERNRRWTAEEDAALAAISALRHSAERVAAMAAFAQRTGRTFGAVRTRRDKMQQGRLTAAELLT